MNIQTFLTTVNYDDVGKFCSYVYNNYIKDNNKAYENFILLCKWDFRTSGAFEICDQPEKDYEVQYNKAVGILRTTVNNLIEQDVGEDEFYKCLFDNLNNKSLFADGDDFIGALIYILDNDRIPYFRLEKPVDISDEEFSGLYEKLNQDIQKSLYIFNRGYEYRTEVASQLLRIIESKESEKEKIVLLTGILHYLEWSTAKNCEKAEEEKNT